MLEFKAQKSLPSDLYSLEEQIGMAGHKIAIATVSLGWHPSHTLEWKLDSAARQGFEGVEIYYPDLELMAKQQNLSLLEAARKVAGLCIQRRLTVVALQPMFDFPGLLTPLEERLDAAQEYIEIARALGSNTIQVPSTYHQESVGDEDIIVAELRALADLGLEGAPGMQPMMFAYEALAWGVHHALLDDAVRTVKLVDRPNFGLCLDTYHVLARIWADPHAPKGGKGIVAGGPAALKGTLRRFMQDCPVEKIFYLQLSDAEKLGQPIAPGSPVYKPEWESWDATMHYCVWGRLFPFENELGAYFPMQEILQVWLKDKQWSGWVSMEIFHRDEALESMNPDVLATRGAKS